MKKQESRKILAIALLATILLGLGGVWSYFTVYTPYYNAQKTRLLTFTAHLTPVHLDPALAGDTSSFRAVMNIFDRLVQYKQGSFDIRPSLAASWETPDNLTYTFNLRKDVSFQDGTPFNASCVKYSFERALNLRDAMGDDYPGTAYVLDFIDGIMVLDNYKVQITLAEQFSGFLQIMAHPSASIVSPSAAEETGTGDGTGFDVNPIGSGPYRFDIWTTFPNSELVLKANKQYFIGAPTLERLVFKNIIESSDRLLQITRGGIDADLDCTGLTIEDFSSLRNNPDVIVHNESGLSIEFLAINTQKAPFNDTKVRQAIAYAIDYDSIIHDALAGAGQRISGPVAPGISGYADLPLIHKDVGKAKQLLTEAGYPEGFQVTIIYNIDNLNRRKEAEIIKNSLNVIGIDVTLEGLDWNSVVEKYVTFNYDIGLDLWVPDYFDADTYLRPLYTTGGDYNEFGYSNANVDQLINQAKVETNPDLRLSEYQQAQQMIVNDVPAVYLFTPTYYELVRFDIGNYVQNPTGYFNAYNLYRL